MFKKPGFFMLTALIALVAGFNIWGAATQGSMEPALNAERESTANRVVMVLVPPGPPVAACLKPLLMAIAWLTAKPI